MGSSHDLTRSLMRSGRPERTFSLVERIATPYPRRELYSSRRGVILARGARCI